MNMFVAWMDDDVRALDDLIGNLPSAFWMVFRLLILVLGGTIQAIANHAGEAFDDVIPTLQAQLPSRSGSLEAAEVADLVELPPPQH